MIFIAILLVAIAFGFLSWVLCDRFECFGLMCFACVALVIFAIVGCVMGIDYVSDTINYNANCYTVAATRAMYVDELEKYDEMRDTDVTASSTYLELREKVIDFNAEIERARDLESPWLKHTFYEAAYLTVEPIEIEVG